MADDEVRDALEIAHDGVRTKPRDRGLVFDPVEKNRTATGAMTGFHIGQAIPYDPAARKVRAMVAGRGQKHSGLRMK